MIILTTIWYFCLKLRKQTQERLDDLLNDIQQVGYRARTGIEVLRCVVQLSLHIIGEVRKKKESEVTIIFHVCMKDRLFTFTGHRELNRHKPTWGKG